MATLDAIVLGGGSGARFGRPHSSQRAKQFQWVADRPVFVHALLGLLKLPSLRQVVLVFPKSEIAYGQSLVDRYLPIVSKSQVTIVAGGDSRQQSAWSGIQAIEAQGTLPHRVLIHDACRPYLAKSFLHRIEKIIANKNFAAWVPVIPVTDTLKIVSAGQVDKTLNRSECFRAQTPQIFDFGLIRSLHKRASQKAQEFTDDASLCEAAGIPVGVYEGESTNIKLTYPHEVEILRPLLKEGKLPCDSALDTTFTV